jgi:hypothetical protein
MAGTPKQRDAAKRQAAANKSASKKSKPNCVWSAKHQEMMCSRTDPQKATQDMKRAEIERQRQQEAERQRKAQMDAQRRAQAEAQQRAQAEAQRRAQMEAQQRAQAEAQRRAQMEAQQRAQADAQRRAQMAEQQRAQMEVQRRQDDLRRAEAEKRRQDDIREAEINRKRGAQARIADADQRATPRPPTTASIGTDSGLWSHNGSHIRLSSSNERVVLEYEKPRADLDKLGIKPGTILFQGTTSGNVWTGEASMFSRRCGERVFQVTGSALADGRRVELRGKKPNLDGQCNVAGYRDGVLVFVRTRAD